MNEGTVSRTRARPGAGAFVSEDHPSAGVFAHESRGRRVQYAGKRTLDYVGAAVGLLLLSPVMLGVAVAIRLGSDGPALFRQRRTGRHGEAFLMWKFRTMACDAEDRMGELERLNESPGGVLFKLRRDPRVTRIGRVLRRTSLDELPQLFNVLQGQMSLVGPRPLPLRDCARLAESDAAGFHIRHRVLPGITGPWQLGGRSEVGHERMIAMDVEYVRNWSFVKDLFLILRSVVIPWTGRGAH